MFHCVACFKLNILAYSDYCSVKKKRILGKNMYGYKKKQKKTLVF